MQKKCSKKHSKHSNIQKASMATDVRCICYLLKNDFIVTRKIQNPKFIFICREVFQLFWSKQMKLIGHCELRM